MQTQPSLTARLKKLGFAPGNQMRLYGEKFEIAGEPIFISNHEVLVDAIEMRSRTLKRLRIPLPVLNVAHQKGCVTSALEVFVIPPFAHSFMPAPFLN